MLSTNSSSYELTQVNQSYSVSKVNLDSSIGQHVGGGVLAAQMAVERPFKTYPRPSNVASSPFYTSFAAPAPPHNPYNGYPISIPQLSKPDSNYTDCMNTYASNPYAQTQHHHHYHHHHQQMILHNQASAAVEESLKQRQLKIDDEDSSSSAGSNGSTMVNTTSKKRPCQRKDDQYWDKRQKNNDSAKRSREARRVKEEQISMRVVCLEQENLQLRTELSLLKTDIDKLRLLLY